MNKNTGTEIALKLLASKSYSELQLRQKLRQKKVCPPEIEIAINYVTESGYLADTKYANDIYQHHFNAGKYGRSVIRAKLKQAGIADNTITEVLSQYTPEDEYAHGLEQVTKHFKQRVDNAKMARFLTTRGYNYDTIKKITENISKGNLE